MAIARLILKGKIANSRSILQRESRNHGHNERLLSVISKLAGCAKRIEKANNIAEAVGIEGDVARAYFEIFDLMIHGKGFSFSGRVRRPPTDPVNALLSFSYTLVTHDCSSALQGVGLDPYVGFLHQDRPGRVSLALDLAEEFRSFWADRLVLTLINRGQIQLKDFRKEASGAVFLKDDAKKKFLTSWQERKRDEITHPYFNEKVSIGILPHCQAMLLARHIRGDTEFYTPFLVK